MKLLEEAELTSKIEAELQSIYQSVDIVARPFLAAHEQIQKMNRRVVKMMLAGLLIYIFVPGLAAVLGSPVIATAAVVTAIVLCLKTQNCKTRWQFSVVVSFLVVSKN